MKAELSAEEIVSTIKKIYSTSKKHLKTMQNEEYVSPQIRVVECRVENGFAVSEIEIDGRNMTVIKTLKDINQTVIDLEITDTIETNIIIKSIELIRDDIVSNDEATDRTVIIHNIFISVGE